MKITSAFAFGIILACAILPAQDNESSRASLKGLWGIGVVIADADPAMECEGFGKDQLRTDVEGPLRRAGIKILSEAELLKTPGEPHLYVSLSLANVAATPQRAYYASVEFIQDVALYRSPKQVCRAVTWSASVEGMAGSNDIGKITDSLAALMDRFISAFRSVNPN